MDQRANQREALRIECKRFPWRLQQYICSKWCRSSNMDAHRQFQQDICLDSPYSEIKFQFRIQRSSECEGMELRRECLSFR